MGCAASNAVSAVPNDQTQPGQLVPAVPNDQTQPAGQLVSAVPNDQTQPGQLVPAVPNDQTQPGQPIKEWVFSPPYPSKKEVEKISFRWPASIEVEFQIIRLESGKQWAQILDIGGLVWLYTNTGKPGSGPNGGLGIRVCGRKWHRDRDPLNNGDLVHAVITFDRKGRGGLYTDGELVSGDISKCEHSDAGAPIEDVQNLLLKVGQHQGCVEVREVRIYQGVLEEREVRALYQRNRGETTLGGARLRHIRRQDVLDALSVALRSSNGEWLGWGKDVGRAIGEIEDGCGNMGDNSGDDYDRLELVMGWSVSHEMEETRYKLAKAEVKLQLESLSPEERAEAASQDLHPNFKLKTAEWSAALGSLDPSVNEAVVLHGTSPELLPQILGNGLNERFSSGVFGDGSYLAEDPGKADQYCKVDAGRSEELKLLHNALYPKADGQDDHPGQVCYMLVGKIVMGAPAVTLDGRTLSSSDGQLWASDARRELGPVVTKSTVPFAHHCLLVETGQAVKRYRELVMFHSDRVLITHVLAYRRTKKT